ncbi:MAG: DUF3465 domain-containing protein [Coriobacteriia bacterium]|nr:DUF3465 domain-containing protein [Coriobacteriia bacterium]
MADARLGEPIGDPLIRWMAVLAMTMLLLVSSACVPETLVEVQTPVNDRANGSADLIERAYEQHSHDVQVAGSGTVVRTLADDNDGSRHQRFILELDSGRTLLIAHNIDVAPRIPTVREGDTVEFYGVYEYSDQGGVIHWTHHDPQGHHEDGWLQHEGTVYE